MAIAVGEERRSAPRYRTVQYVALLKRAGLFSSSRSLREAAVVDFNRNGMSLCSESRFKKGDLVELQLRSASEQIKGLHGVVRHVRKDRNEYYLGLEFSLPNMKPIATSPRRSILACMEQVIEHQLA